MMTRRALISGVAALLLAPPDLHRKVWAMGWAPPPYYLTATEIERRWGLLNTEIARIMNRVIVVPGALLLTPSPADTEG